MTKRRIVTLGTLAVVLVIGWSAWTWWPPVLRWRQRQIQRRTERVMLEYLDGKQGLASAAGTLADLWKTGMSIGERLPPVGQTAPIHNPEFQARLMRVDERRINVLLDSAAKLMGSGAGGWTTYTVERDST